MRSNIEIEKPTLLKDLGNLPQSELSNRNRRFGLYKCSCGKEFKTVMQRVNSGATVSCGCYQKRRCLESVTKHGMRKSKLWDVYRGMISRTSDKKNISYRNYGDRGITVCDEWSKSYESFTVWALNNGYKQGLSIDRIDNNGNYEPANCRWATRSIQSQNQRKRKTNITGYKGISRDKSGRYIASIKVNKNGYYLGYFSTAEEGAIAYDTFVIVYGTKHTTNFPKGVFA